MRGIGVAFLAGDRGDVDDAPVVLRDHQRHHGARADERPVEIDAHHLAPFLHVRLPGLGIGSGDAGIVDEDVDAAERLGRWRRAPWQRRPGRRRRRRSPRRRSPSAWRSSAPARYRWSQMATLAPDLRKRSVIALPKPWAPPVTTAARPFQVDDVTRHGGSPSLSVARVVMWFACSGKIVAVAMADALPRCLECFERRFPRGRRRVLWRPVKLLVASRWRRTPAVPAAPRLAGPAKGCRLTGLPILDTRWSGASSRRARGNSHVSPGRPLRVTAGRRCSGSMGGVPGGAASGATLRGCYRKHRRNAKARADGRCKQRSLAATGTGGPGAARRREDAWHRLSCAG